MRSGRLAKKQRRLAERQIAKARTRDSERVVTRRVGKVHDELRFVADPPLVVPVEDLAIPGSEWERADVLIKELLASYRKTLGVDHHPLEEFRYVHAARKVVGVGSVGTRCYMLLLVGRDDSDPLVLQVKEAETSVLERFVAKSVYANHGQRVVAGQRLLQGASDAFLGWQRVKGLDGKPRDYYVRQLHDWKGITEVDEMTVPARPSTAGSAERRWLADTPVGGIASPSRRIWARPTPSTGPSRTSPLPTPIRTNATTRRSPKR